jgi:hypothetical protein
MSKAINFKKIFLYCLVIALSLSALIGIFIFLIGEFAETELRLLLTTLTIGGYSLTALCSATIYNRNALRVFSIIGMGVTAIGFVVTIIPIWEFIEIDDIWKTMIIFIILTVAIAHTSLLLQIKPKTKNIKYSMIVTIFFISTVTLMLIRSTLKEYDTTEIEGRLIGVLFILDVLGTVVTPIFNRIPVKKD